MGKMLRNSKDLVMQITGIRAFAARWQAGGNSRRLAVTVMFVAVSALLYGVTAQEGISISKLRQLASENLARRPSHLASRGGKRRVRIARKREYNTRVRRRKNRASYRQYVRSTPRPKVRQDAGLTVKVLDKKGRPVPNVTMAALIHRKDGTDIKTTKVTNSTGTIVLEKVGPLPALVELDSASPRWKLASADTSDYLIKPTTKVMYYQTAKLRPAVLNLKVRGGAGSRLSTPALYKPTANDAEDATPADSAEAASPEENAVGTADAAYTDDLPETDTAIENISDEQEVELPATNLEDGDVPIVLARDLPGGAAESVIYDYDEDAEQDEVSAKPPRLVTVNSVTIANDVSVLSTDDEVERVKGWKKPKDKKLLINTEDGLTDGSEWWVYPAFGVALKMRPTHIKNQHLTERIRLLAPAGGDISGIKVGSSVADLRTALGEPQVADAPAIPADNYAAKGHIDSYLDDGLRFCHDGEKVLWIDIARQTELLKSGTIAFARGERARVFVSSFTGHPGINLNSRTSFEKYLKRLPSIEVVDSEEEADLVLNARVTGFVSDKDQLFGSLIPYDYSCQTTMEYDLLDVATGKYIAQNKTLTGTAKASFRKDIYKAIALAVGINWLIGGDIGKYGTYVIAGAQLYRLKRMMQRAANRCPGISERQLFDNLTQEINGVVDYRAQVTEIDYTRGLLTLNVGSRDGVSVSTTERPFEFEVAIGGVPLLNKSEDGRDANYYTAVVREVREDSSVCELRHVNGGVQAADNEIPSTPAITTVRQFPDPTTGVLVARAWTRFAPVEIISDEEIAESERLEKEQMEKAQAQQQAQQAQQQALPQPQVQVRKKKR